MHTTKLPVLVILPSYLFANKNKKRILTFSPQVINNLLKTSEITAKQAIALLMIRCGFYKTSVLFSIDGEEFLLLTPVVSVFVVVVDCCKLNHPFFLRAQ